MFNSGLLPTRLWEYLIATILIVLAPGPSVLFIIARAIAWGRASALATVAGNTAGVFMISLLVAFGLGPLLQRSTLFYNSIQWAGGVYLIYLGYEAIKASKLVASGLQKGEGVKPTLLASAKTGFWVGALNPKTIVFFAAILPAFVDQENSNVTAQLVLLGFIFCAIALISDGTYGLLAGTAREWFASDIKRLILMRRFGGLVMVALGVFTIASIYLL